MAFEGYKKQIQEQDPELQQQLLQIAIDNLGSNPTKVFDKDIKSTPAEVFVEGAGKIIKDVKEIPEKLKN